MTPLDRAHAAMDAAPDDGAARLRFYERLADAELVLLLVEEPHGDDVRPETVEVEAETYVLAFDAEDRLTAFVGREAPYAAMSGRALAEMLAGQELGLGVNLSVAPSQTLLPAATVGWLAETLAHRPAESEARPARLRPPQGLPEALLTALDAKLATTGGLARSAYLATASYDDDSTGHLLAFVDPLPGAEGALARAVGEALTFSGRETGSRDETFVAAADPLILGLAKVGLRFDLPRLPQPPAPRASGSAPERPPRLR